MKRCPIAKNARTVKKGDQMLDEKVAKIVATAVFFFKSYAIQKRPKKLPNIWATFVGKLVKDL